MGVYLNMTTSTKNNPNENYAREIMQLFSIGNGAAQPGRHDAERPGHGRAAADRTTSRSSTSSSSSSRLVHPERHGLAARRHRRHRRLHQPDGGAPQRRGRRGPARSDGQGPVPGVPPNQNGDGSATSIPAAQLAQQDLDQAIDALFYHPNIAPYLARELIHSLVTSNPSPAYIERVAGFFNDNGSGQRGSIWAMVKAVLLDPEARNSPSDPTYGKLKEPRSTS
jgi:hypothetical protein